MNGETATGRNWIGGEWRGSVSGAQMECRAPYDSRLLAATYPASAGPDVDQAVAAARSAQSEWASMRLAQREQVLNGAADLVLAAGDEISRIISTEMAKPVGEAEGEVKRAAAALRFFAGEMRRPLGETYESDDPETFLYTAHRPLGVVGLITPWNFPIAIPAWKLAPALAYGNAVVMKPASEAPGAALVLARCLHDAGLPAGALNVVVGSGPDAGAPLVANPGLDAISYTGSNAVGDTIRATAAQSGIAAQLELGGQNPAVVLRDADLDVAADAIAAGAFGNTGQKCTATRRAILDRRVAADMTEMLATRAAEIVPGDPHDPASLASALINDGAAESFERAVERAVAAGARVVSGGRRLRSGAHAHGHYVEPTVIEGVQPGSELARDEVFAPLLAILEVDGADEALRLANDVTFGLSASIFTRDLGHARRFAQGAEAGVIHVNSQTAGADVHVPFGGMKGSGLGPREQGRAAREFYSELTTVYETRPQEG